MAGLAGRMALGLTGAALTIVSAFLPWTEGVVGTQLDVRAFWAAQPERAEMFVASVGAVAIAIGLLAVLGLALRGGGLTRLAGALGVVGFALFVIQRYRAEAPLPEALGLGAWLLLIGSVVALVGGFVGGSPLPADIAPDHAHE
ncbi:MAG TPA: sugar:proton symporter [Actinomycetota bacterium]|nr:sugar:proton symporter [Actinomycetota bacterium]